MIASTYGLGRLAMQDEFSTMERSSEKTLIFVPNSILNVAGAASRVKMNAKVRRP